MVLKRLKFTCPTNRKIDACMRKEKQFQNSSKINKLTSIGIGPKAYYCQRGNSPNDIIGVSHDIISGGTL